MIFVRKGFPSWVPLSDGFVDLGWHNMVLDIPGEQVKELLKFEFFTGCRLCYSTVLEGEAKRMMRNYLVEA